MRPAERSRKGTHGFRLCSLPPPTLQLAARASVLQHQFTSFHPPTHPHLSKWYQTVYATCFGAYIIVLVSVGSVAQFMNDFGL